MRADRVKWRLFGLALACAFFLAFRARLQVITHSRIEIEESSLTITGLANAAKAATTAAESMNDCLRAFKLKYNRALDIVFIGHSRARQLFESLIRVTGSRYMHRSEKNRADFLDRGDIHQGKRFMQANSTCLGVWPKPQKEGRPTQAWCSHEANGSLLHSTFRWRHSMHSLGDAFDRVLVQCWTAAHLAIQNRSPTCPDILVYTQGLHLAAVLPFQHVIQLYTEVFMSLRQSVTALKRLGVTVVWLPEVPGNPGAGAHSHTDDTMVANTLVTELWKFRHAEVATFGWTAVLMSAADLWTRVCTYLIATDRASHAQKRLCSSETYHVDESTAQNMIAQIIKSVRLAR